MNNEVAIVVPLYNEGSAIKSVLNELREKRPNDAIIAVDDGSTDDSYKNGCQESVYLLKHLINLGQGAAIQTGIQFAKRLGCKYVVMFDSDGQHDPDDIEPFINKLRSGEFDIILGSRFLGVAKNIPMKKVILLKLSKVFTLLTTGLWLSDSHNGFRALNIEKNPNFEITQNRMAHASEIIDIIRDLKMKYIEMPCHIRYTAYSMGKGQSAWNSINIVIDYLIGKASK